MKNPHRQSGITLVVSLIMLVVLTLLVVSAIRFGNINLRIAGNAQTEAEASAATQVALEQMLQEINTTEKVDTIAAKPAVIISTGGGVVGRERNRTLLRQLGYVVWLQAPMSVILERTAKNRDRPLLHTDNPAERIKTLMEHRYPLYAETAHLAVDTAGLDGSELAAGILESARYYFTCHP